MQSLSNKIDEINLFLNEINFDVICFSEHWLDDDKIKLVNLNDYKLGSFFYRDINRHGGVAIFLKSNLDFKAVNLQNYCVAFEAEFCAIELTESKILIVSIYRPCSGNFNSFLDTFESLLIFSSARYKSIILVGDFNTDFNLKTPNTTNLITLISSFNIHSTISVSTRVTPLTSSCIDNILTNMDMSEIQTGVLDPLLSDHYGQFIIINYESQSPKSDFYYRRLYTNSKFEDFKFSLKNINWTTIFESNSNASNMMDLFIQIFVSQIQCHFKLCKVSNESKSPVANWFSESLSNMRNTLNCLKTISVSTKKDIDIANYNSYRKLYRQEITRCKKSSYSNFILQSNNKMRDCWKLINKKRNVHTTMKPSSNISCDEFNAFFTSVSENIIKDLPNDNLDASNFKINPQNSHTRFELSEITEQEVLEATLSLNNSKCRDVYDIDIRIIKESINEIIYPLTFIFNICLTEGVFPNSLKYTKVVPLYKKGDRERCGKLSPYFNHTHVCQNFRNGY